VDGQGPGLCLAVVYYGVLTSEYTLLNNLFPSRVSSNCPFIPVRYATIHNTESTFYACDRRSLV
jgi:hypothetical protein